MGRGPRKRAARQAARFSPERHHQIWQCVRGPFLLPPRFSGHVCEWEPFSYTQAGCTLCGVEHRCGADNPECQVVTCDGGHVVCQITGAVVRDSEPRDDRVVPCDMWTFVHDVVCTLLRSAASRRCIQQETERLYQVLIMSVQREMRRQLAADGFVNMVAAITVGVWHTRKLRRPVVLSEDATEGIVRVATDAITKIMLTYTSEHTSKILNSDVRRRQFACSMLYLMRSGVECRGTCVLPKMEIMGTILPLENCLPDYFRISPKSITEGENLLKIELRRMHNI